MNAVIQSKNLELYYGNYKALKGIAMDITPPTLCRGNVYLKQSYSQNICVPLTSDEIHMELDIAINVN